MPRHLGLSMIQCWVSREIACCCLEGRNYHSYVFFVYYVSLFVFLVVICKRAASPS